MLDPKLIDGVIVVDDFYKNYDLMYQVLQNSSAPRWKWHSEGRNFKDYFDCRITLSYNTFVDFDRIKINTVISKLIKDFYQVKEKIYLQNSFLEFNVYKNIKKDIPNNLQHHPHIDHCFNCIVYMDQVSSGGTAIYDTLVPIVNQENVNLLYDISGLDFNLIESKPNRLVIFPGWFYHGGYIEDHNMYLDDWRVNNVMFFNSEST